MLICLLCLSLSLTNFSADFLVKNVIGKKVSKPYFVMFGSENCPACVLSKPEFLKAENSTSGFIHFGYADAIECSSIAFQLGFNSLPSFYLFFESQVYRYPLITKTSKKLLSFLSAKICDGVNVVGGEWFENDGDKILLFQKRLKPTLPFAIAYSVFHKEGVKFGITGDTSIIEKYGVHTNHSTVLLLRSNNDSAIEINGISVSSFVHNLSQLLKRSIEL